MTLITRKEYMDSRTPYVPGQVSDIFRAYYGQFVNDWVKQAVIAKFGIERLLASHDIHFNDLSHEDWDRIAGIESLGAHIPSWVPQELMEEAGDCYTIAGGICIAKEAARIACEEYRARENDK